jgi:hypothetical protein
VPAICHHPHVYPRQVETKYARENSGERDARWPGPAQQTIYHAHGLIQFEFLDSGVLRVTYIQAVAAIHD